MAAVHRGIQRFRFTVMSVDVIGKSRGIDFHL